MSKTLLSKDKHTFNNTRRGFIKAVTCTSALTVTGLSSLALASKGSATFKTVEASISQNSVVSNPDIRIIQETLIDRETVTLINESGKLQLLDARQPISLHQVTGMLIVTVNQNNANAVNGMVFMSPNERFTFDVKAIDLDVSQTKTDVPMLTTFAENQLQISSNHSVFNRIVPVQLA